MTIAEAPTSKSFVFARPYPTWPTAPCKIACLSERSPSTTHQKDLHPVVCTLHIRPYTSMHQVEKYAQPPRHGEFTHSPNLHNSCLPPTSPIRSISPSVPDRPTTRFRFHPSKKPQRNRPTEPKLFLLSRLLTSAEPENLLNAWSVMHMIVASLVGRAENHSDFSNTTRWSFPCLSQNTCASLRDLPNNFELSLATRGNLLVVMIGVARLTSIRPCYAGVHCCTILQVLI